MGKVVANMIQGAAGLLELFADRPDCIRFIVKPCADDGRATKSDWQAVGDDIKAAIDMSAPPKGAGNAAAQKGRQ